MFPSGAPAIRVLIVDDHAVVRTGLESLLGILPGVDKVATAGTAAEALELCASFHPHVVLLDLRMPDMDGLTLLQSIRQEWPYMRAIIFTGVENPMQAAIARKHGAAGYVNKCDSPERLLAALEAVAGGGIFFPDDSDGALTVREIEVLREASRGRTNEEIGRILGIAGQTVKGHLRNIFPKLQAANRAEAVARAHELGLL